MSELGGLGLYYDRQGNRIDIDRWGELFENEEYHRIGLQKFEGGVRVSTVWMGIDHGFGRPIDPAPVIFETMIFGPDDYPYQEAQMRYCTEDEAVEGHRRTCDDVEHGRRPWFLVDDMESVDGQ